MRRLLTIMGSGETAPTMIKVHRELMEAVGATTETDSVLLDTPYGFQENAEDISSKAREYFRASVGRPISVAGWRSRDDDVVSRERATAAVADARYVFAGPGSPTYALELWRGTALPALLADKLRTGGAVTFASAAALTLGARSVPVYEIYKVGARPVWLDGLDLLGPLGMSVAVIPHFDNAEGGGHDTRFCYLGDRRLRGLEAGLGDDQWVLGVDEHTALVMDLDAGTGRVAGHGTVTVRARGASVEFPTGSEFALDDLGPGRTAGHGAAAGTASTVLPAATDAPARDVGPGLAAATAETTSRFDAALIDRDPDAAVAAALDLEQSIVDWSADTLQSDEADRARAALRRMIVRLGELATVGAQDPRTVVAPFVEAVLNARARARGASLYDLADHLRDTLTGAGVEVRDTPEGAEWHLTD